MAIKSATELAEAEKKYKADFIMRAHQVVSELESSKDAIELHGLSIHVDDSVPNIQLKCGEYVVYEAVVSRSTPVVVLCNDYISDGPNSFKQVKVADAFDGASIFGMAVEPAINEFKRNKDVLKTLGNI
ncbi:hypothetical protein [Labrenzia sp. CE80]|uniref:hypothetical protein n=1 Tax=Labrenzia sp. CE80 TaxID=1788986 RepID=UPI00129BFFA5|nr:hypothetical protein [Labrenzia sp. CE80]